jgi:hypothetical protein
MYYPRVSRISGPTTSYRITPFRNTGCFAWVDDEVRGTG